MPGSAGAAFIFHSRSNPSSGLCPPGPGRAIAPAPRTGPLLACRVPRDILPQLQELGQGSGAETGASHTCPKGSDSVVWPSCLPHALPRQPSTLSPPLPLPSLPPTTTSQHIWAAGLEPCYPINRNYRKSSSRVLGKTQFYLSQVWLVPPTFFTGLWQGPLGHRTQTGDTLAGEF